MTEIWKDIIGYENLYRVSNKGNVKSLDRVSKFHTGYGIKKGKVLKLTVDKNGYHRISLYKDGKSKKHFVHRLVAKAFIEKRKGKHHINHLDGNPKNNVVENLEWCTPKENTAHAYKNGLISFKYKGDGKDIVQDYEKGLHMTEIAEKYEIHHTTVKSILIKNNVKIIGKRAKLLRNPDDTKKVMQLRDRGLSYQSIARYFGVSKPTVMRLVADVRSDYLSKE